jgi:hypothetical protein
MRSSRTLFTAAIMLSLAIGTAEAQQQGKATNRTRGNSGKVAPGLQKQGGLPPGQAKKRYRTDDGLVVLRDVLKRRGYTVVRSTRSNDVRYVYYRVNGGPVRRAAVRPGPERLVFSDVPQVVLREVIARLY